VLERIQTLSTTVTDSGRRSYDAGMNGSLFELPGGQIGIAFGGEVRHEWRQSDVDHDANIRDLGLRIGNTDYFAERDVYGGYLELRWPVYDGIELQTAGRADYYTDIEKAAANPTLGITISPADIAGRDNTAPALRRLQIRGHASSAFRAPDILDASSNAVVIPTQLPFGPGGTPLFLPINTSGNPDLDHEQALALSAGFAWTMMDELNLVADFWHFQYEDRIARDDPRQKVAAWQAADCPLNFPGIHAATSAAGCTPNSTGLISEIDVAQENTEGTTLTNGLDFGVIVSLTGETFGGSTQDWGTLSFGAEGTYTLTYEIPRHAILPDVVTQGVIECDGNAPDSACDVVGNRNFNNLAAPLPALRVNFPVTWLHQGHAASFIAHYMGPLEDDHDGAHRGDFTSEPIDPFFTMDLQYGYTIKDWVGDALTLRLGVNNLADQDPPPVLSETAGFEPMLHDPRGRLVYAKLISEF